MPDPCSPVQTLQPLPVTAFDLSHRSFLRFTGKDRLRYLNGQLTQDLRRLTPEKPLPACVTNAKGRLQAVVWVTEFPDSILLDSDPGQHETLVPRLDRYIVADDVVLEDLSGQFGLFHFTGADPSGRPEFQGLKITQVSRLGQVGWDVWLPPTQLEELKRLLAHEFSSEARWEQLRVAQGIPKWGAELGEDTLPPEAGLDLTHIDYHKGCYIGQEVISRLKSVGHVNRTLVRLKTVSGEQLPELGGGLFLMNVPGAEPVGKIASAVQDASGEGVVLAYVKRGVDAREFQSANGIPLVRF